MYIQMYCIAMYLSMIFGFQICIHRVLFCCLRFLHSGPVSVKDGLSDRWFNINYMQNRLSETYLQPILEGRRVV